MPKQKLKKTNQIQSTTERIKNLERLLDNYKYTVARHQKFFRGLMNVATSDQKAQDKLNQIVGGLESMKADILSNSLS